MQQALSDGGGGLTRRTTNTRETPGLHDGDAALRYARGGLEGSVNATNLFDKDYYSICYARTMLTARF